MVPRVRSLFAQRTGISRAPASAEGVRPILGFPSWRLPKSGSLVTSVFVGSWSAPKVSPSSPLLPTQAHAGSASRLLEHGRPRSVVAQGAAQLPRVCFIARVGEIPRLPCDLLPVICLPLLRVRGRPWSAVLRGQIGGTPYLRVQLVQQRGWPEAPQWSMSGDSQ